MKRQISEDEARALVRDVMSASPERKLKIIVAMAQRIAACEGLIRLAEAYAHPVGPRDACHWNAVELRELAWLCNAPLDCEETLKRLRDVLESVADAFEAYRALTIQG